MNLKQLLYMVEQTVYPSAAKQTRIPALDGLRALSIVLVILSHIRTAYDATPLTLFWRLDPGPTGVSIFFVISGYLITSLLLRERSCFDGINLKHFYFRRFFRIFPAYFMLLAMLTLLRAGGLVEVEWSHFVPALFYLTNYISVDRVLFHSWSLSVEEQFYLLYPFLLSVCRTRTTFWILTATLFVSPLARFANEVIGVWPFEARYSFEGRADQLAFGCLCAMIQNASPQGIRNFLNRYALILGCLGLIAAISLPPGNIRIVAFNTFIGLSAALVVYGCTANTNAWLARALDLPPLRMIGMMSYSIYLWQQVWLIPGNTIALPWALLGIAVCSLASYRFVEKPFLRWRSEIETQNVSLACHLGIPNRK